MGWYADDLLKRNSGGFELQSLSDLADEILENQSGGLAWKMFESDEYYLKWNFCGEISPQQVARLVELADAGGLHLDMLIEMLDIAENVWLTQIVAETIAACKNEDLRKELIAYCVCDGESILPPFTQYVAALKDLTSMHYAVLQNTVEKYGEVSEKTESLLKQMHAALCEEEYEALVKWLAEKD